MAAKDQPVHTPAEYFILEERAGYKSEYRQGEIVAMAGGSVNHNRIAGNIFNALSSALEAGPCEVFMSDLRLQVQRRNLYTYPDVMVICGGPIFAERRTDTVTNPRIIVEVLSDSTENYDRSDKFQAYWTLDTFEEYVLVDQYRPKVEYFRRLDEKTWEINVLTDLDDILLLKSIGAEVMLGRIYRNVNWNEPVSVT